METSALFKKYPGYSVISVCHLNNIEQATRDGWVLLDVLPYGELDSCVTDFPIINESNYPDGQVYRSVTTHMVKLPFSRASLAFIVGLGEETHLTRMEQAKRELTTELALLKAKQEGSEKELGVVKKNLEEERRMVEYHKGQTERAEKAGREVYTKVYQMEKDLGKLRTVVGDTEFRRITWACSCEHGPTEHDENGCRKGECSCKATWLAKPALPVQR